MVQYLNRPGVAPQVYCLKAEEQPFASSISTTERKWLARRCSAHTLFGLNFYSFMLELTESFQSLSRSGNLESFRFLPQHSSLLPWQETQKKFANVILTLHTVHEGGV